MFARNSIVDTVALETTDKIKRFDSLVAPILNYSSEVWGFLDANHVESIHLKLKCPSYTELRNTHIPRYYRTWPTINKFRLLINTNSEIKIRNIATFLYHAFKKRNSQQ